MKFGYIRDNFSYVEEWLHQFELYENQLKKMGCTKIFFERKFVKNICECEELISQIKKGDTVLVPTFGMIAICGNFPIYNIKNNFKDKGIDLLTLDGYIDTRQKNILCPGAKPVEGITRKEIIDSLHKIPAKRKKKKI